MSDDKVKKAKKSAKAALALMDLLIELMPEKDRPRCTFTRTVMQIALNSEKPLQMFLTDAVGIAHDIMTMEQKIKFLTQLAEENGGTVEVIHVKESETTH